MFVFVCLLFSGAPPIASPSPWRIPGETPQACGKIESLQGGAGWQRVVSDARDSVAGRVWIAASGRWAALAGTDAGSPLAARRSLQARTSSAQRRCLPALPAGLCTPGTGHTQLLSVNSVSSPGFFFFFLNWLFPLETQLKSVNCMCFFFFSLQFGFVC